MNAEGEDSGRYSASAVGSAAGTAVERVEADALLQLDRVNLSIHGTPILRDISLQVEVGQTLGVIGESGSGKSMTALSIMQLLPRGARLEGSIRFAGQYLHTLPETDLCELRGSEIGMIFQEPMTALNPVKSIGDQVSESIRLHRKVGRREALELTAFTLERVGLPNAGFPLDRYPHELSGGQRQRVVIAIAVACQPRLLIADEPTTALDVTTQAGILDLLRSLQQEENLALMLISHDLAVVSSMADSVVVIQDGVVMESGDLNAVFGNPAHPYTRRLFEASALTQLTRTRRHTPAEKNADEPGVARADEQAVVRLVEESTDVQAGEAGDEVSGEAGGSGDAGRSLQGPAEPLLRVESLVCEYPGRRLSLFSRGMPFRAVDDVSFEIRRGQSVGLVGESGCGKSTLTRALLGLMSLHSGSVTLNGERVIAARDVSRAARRQMQVVFQDPYGSFNPRHKVARLVSEPLHVLDGLMDAGMRRSRLVQVLESVGLQASDSDKYIHEFSGGQRQRVAIARALIIRPSLIILDEAVSALDVSVRAQVLELLEQLAREQGLAYLFIAHDLSVVQRVCDRVMVMRRGRIVEQGETARVFSDPRHEYTQELLAATPVLKLNTRSTGTRPRGETEQVGEKEQAGRDTTSGRDSPVGNDDEPV